MRPRLTGVLQAWAACGQRWAEAPPLRWSPLFRTAPVGGPPGQPPYVNAVLLAEGTTGADPMALLLALQSLESAFGRQRQVRWGPRSLDLDLLWCEGHRRESAALWLPHPRWRQRAFVRTPLAALAPERVAALPVLKSAEPAPERLPPRPGWPE